LCRVRRIIVHLSGKKLPNVSRDGEDGRGEYGNTTVLGCTRLLSTSGSDRTDNGIGSILNNYELK
jgi:hypothetical protein